jgi:hypothetical protein
MILLQAEMLAADGIEELPAPDRTRPASTVAFYQPGLLSPATCCLINLDGVKTVGLTLCAVRELFRRLREEFRLA